MLSAFNNNNNNNKATGYVKKRRKTHQQYYQADATWRSSQSPAAPSSIFFNYVVQYDGMFCCDIISDKNIAGPTNWEDTATSNRSTAHSSCVHTHSRSYHYLTIYTRRFKWLLYFQLQANGCHYTNSVLLKGSRIRSRLVTDLITNDRSVSATISATTRATNSAVIRTTNGERGEWTEDNGGMITLPTLCFHVMYQLNALTIHDITVTLLLHVSA